MINANASVTNIVRAKNPDTFICENGKYLKSIADTSVIACDEITNATDSVSTNVTNLINTISANATSTVPLNFNDKKVKYKMDCDILHTFLLVIILLFIIAIICYHYAKHRSKQKDIGALTI